MRYKNIFEILKDKWKIVDEVKRIFILLNTDCLKIHYEGDKTISQLKEKMKWLKWRLTINCQ